MNDKWPSNTDDTIYLFGSNTLNDIIAFAQDKWGDDINFDNLIIEHERIKLYGCSCCYDPSDYKDFITIGYKK